jgi:hypothetical protein
MRSRSGLRRALQNQAVIHPGNDIALSVKTRIRREVAMGCRGPGCRDVPWTRWNVIFSHRDFGRTNWAWKRTVRSRRDARRETHLEHVDLLVGFPPCGDWKLVVYRRCLTCCLMRPGSFGERKAFGPLTCTIREE